MDEKIIAKINRQMELDEDFVADCSSYDDMDALVWTLPAGFANRPEIRKRVSTDAHDTLKTAINLFDTHHPKWEIIPRGPADLDKAEELERWLEWVMETANQNGDEEPNRTMLKHAAKYGRIAAQLDFRPYWCQEGTEDYKEATANPFCITVHPAANIRYERGKYGLLWVANVSNVPAVDVISHWSEYQTDPEYGDKITSAISKIESLIDESTEVTQRLIYVDYTDKKKRLVFAYPTKSETMDDELSIPEDVIEIVDGENKLGFINWAISKVSSEPLLYSMHKGGIFENQCFLDTLADTTVIRRAWYPNFIHESMNGSSMEVDFTGNEAVIETNAANGEKVIPITPPPLDPGVREMMDRNSQKAASATGLKGLQNMNVVGNVQFASVNAMIQVSKSTLDPYLTAYQHNAVELAKLAFLWIQKSGIKVTGYRTKSKTPEKVKGQKINVGPEDFDPKTMLIKCELLSVNPSDEMQRMNVYNMAKQIQLPIPDSLIVENMGWGSPEVLKSDWMKEQVEKTALQIFQQAQAMQLQMQAQQAQMAQQQAAMQQQGMSPPDQGGGSPMISNANGQGNNPAVQGNPPAMAAPQDTRTVTQGPQ